MSTTPHEVAGALNYSSFESLTNVDDEAEGPCSVSDRRQLSCEQKGLHEALKEAFDLITTDAENAQRLKVAMWDVVNISVGDNRHEALELQCYKSNTFRSNLLLLIFKAKHRLIRRELQNLDQSIIAMKLSSALLDHIDKIQELIISWKCPLKSHS
jgi:hypothetical protein